MFKNSVIKVSVDTKKWLKKAGVRAVKTMAQTFVATVGTATVMGAVDWKMVLSASVLASILCLKVLISQHLLFVYQERFVILKDTLHYIQ